LQGDGSSLLMAFDAPKTVSAADKVRLLAR
jgi:hypothetical protein